VIKINIYQNSAVLFKILVKKSFTLFKKGVTVGEGVNTSVHFYSLHNRIRNIPEMIALQMICYKISNYQSGFVASKKGVRQVIHTSKFTYF